VEVKQFLGGLNVPHYKSFSEHKPIKEASLPEEIVIPLSQHLGAPNEPLVKVGDKVKAGQKIGASDKFVSAPVHASLSGTVTAIEPRIPGQSIDCIVIAVDKNRISWSLPIMIWKKLLKKRFLMRLRKLVLSVWVVQLFRLRLS
jgi:Na+-translocating ferredoxin:NAD+ oxidoreductase subunit C